MPGNQKLFVLSSECVHFDLSVYICEKPSRTLVISVLYVFHCRYVIPYFKKRQMDKLVWHGLLNRYDDKEKHITTQSFAIKSNLF